MEKRVERNHSTDAEEVLHLVWLGFYHRQLSAEHCIVTDKGLGPDGSHRFWGHCAWADALQGGRRT